MSGARVVAVDVSAGALDLARKFGAAACVDASRVPDTAQAVRDLSLDAVPAALEAMGTAPGAGVTVIEPWS